MKEFKLILTELCKQLQDSLNENAPYNGLIPYSNVVTLNYTVTPITTEEHGDLAQFKNNHFKLEMFINTHMIASCSYLQSKEEPKSIEILLYRRVLRTVFFNGAISIQQQAFKNAITKGI